MSIMVSRVILIKYARTIEFKLERSQNPRSKYMIYSTQLMARLTVRPKAENKLNYDQFAKTNNTSK